MKTRVNMLAFLLCFVPVTLYAQSDEIKELTLEAIEADKKRIVAINMKLNEVESSVFWPLYEEYQEALAKMEDRMLEVLKAYAESYHTMSDETAQNLLSDYFAIEEQWLQLKKTYAKKFGEALPMKRVVRYFQIENKIEAMTKAGLVRLVPLVK